jgi:fructose-bisphosphate aldolase class II
MQNKNLTNQNPEYLELIKRYEREGKCIAHFNISNLDQARAIVEVASEMNEPVIIGVSEGEREYMGVHMVRKIVDELKAEYNIPIYLNADHTYTFEKVVDVVEAGYDSVIVDGAKLEYEENIALVKKCADWVREYEIKNSTDGKIVKVLVEAELGYIGQSSSLNESLPEGVTEENLTTPDQGLDFVTRTGIDMFAPAVGNVHGMLINATEPELKISRIKELKEKLPNTPFVLHGASGNTDKDLIDAIDAGISIIHINTEIRKAFTDGVRSFLNSMLKEIAPYKYGKVGQDEMKKVVRAKMELYRK